MLFSVPIADFEFEKALMRDHFNEKYLESDKFPQALFQGKLIGYDLTLTGEQKVKGVGQITIHGVSRDLEVNGLPSVHRQ
ncbi:MAG: YceI family protein [Cytophagales bacterium]|nr:YceI family protein [Cytophagales bacterium]